MQTVAASLSSEQQLLQIHGQRRLDIQGLRAIAVLMVVAFHAGLPVPGGFVGVDVFFVISGFVITAMLRREWEATSQIRFVDFYVRRFKRLTPALALMVGVTILMSALLLSPTGTQQAAAETGVGAMLFAANLVIYKTTGDYFDGPAHENPLLNTWSLSVEEQFYIAFPLLLLGCWRFGRNYRHQDVVPFVLIGLLALASFSLALLASSDQKHLFSGYQWLVSFYSPVVRAWEFSLGALIVLAGRRLDVITRRTSAALGYAGLSALVASVWLISDETPFPGVWTLLPVAGTVFLIIAGRRGTGLVTRGLGARPLVLLGDWSYSIYLWHWPLIVFAGVIAPGDSIAVALAVGLSLPLALASYYGVEQPIRASSTRRIRTLTGLVAVTMMLPLVLGISLAVSARHWFWLAPVERVMAPVEALPAGFKDPACMSRIPIDRRDIDLCHWHPAATGSPVYLVGDSNAVHFSNALIGAGEILQRPVSVLGSDGCPLIDAHFKRRTDESLLLECRHAYVALMNWLVEQRPGTIMLSSVDRYWRDADYRISLDPDLLEGKRTSNIEALTLGLENTVRRLQAAGHSIILIQSIPPFITAPHRIKDNACSGWNIMVGTCEAPSSTMPLAFADGLQAASRTSILKVAAKTGAGLLELRSILCPGQVCSTRHPSGVDLYMLDGYHLNKGGSALLESAFVDALRSTDERAHD